MTTSTRTSIEYRFANQQSNNQPYEQLGIVCVADVFIYNIISVH